MTTRTADRRAHADGNEGPFRHLYRRRGPKRRKPAAMTCTHCGKRDEADPALANNRRPRCAACGGVLAEMWMGKVNFSGVT